MGDTNFFNAMPEFIPLSVKMKVINAAPGARGCGSCRQRRVIQNTFQDFMHTLGALSPDACVRLRNYFGVPAIMFNARDTAGRVQLRII